MLLIKKASPRQKVQTWQIIQISGLEVMNGHATSPVLQTVYMCEHGIYLPSDCGLDFQIQEQNFMLPTISIEIT